MRIPDAASKVEVVDTGVAPGCAGPAVATTALNDFVRSRTIPLQHPSASAPPRRAVAPLHKLLAQGFGVPLGAAAPQLTMRST